MITLPESPAPNGAQASLIDYGLTIRGAVGGASVRVDRPGSRFRLAVSYPPMDSGTARVFVSRLIRAKSEGLRIPFPLLGQSQGAAGSPVVDGANQTGTTLDLRAATPGFGIREGAWLSIQDAEGQHYLHNSAAFTRVAADGTAALPIAPALRAPFADGATIHLAVPMIEGFVEGESADWALAMGNLVQIGFTIEEAA